jgi:hypothetical protein
VLPETETRRLRVTYVKPELVTSRRAEAVTRKYSVRIEPRSACQRDRDTTSALISAHHAITYDGDVQLSGSDPQCRHQCRPSDTAPRSHPQRGMYLTRSPGIQVADPSEVDT